MPRTWKRNFSKIRQDGHQCKPKCCSGIDLWRISVIDETVPRVDRPPPCHCSYCCNHYRQGTWRNTESVQTMFFRQLQICPLCTLACIDALRHGEARSSGVRHDKLKIRRTEHGRRESRAHAPSRTSPLVRAPMSRKSSPRKSKRPSPSPRTSSRSSPSRSSSFIEGPTTCRSSTFGARRIMGKPPPPHRLADR